LNVTLSDDKVFQAGPISPVVLATCVDAKGRPNVITLGMYMSISQRPPQVCIGVAPQRYSHDLIAGQGEFVVNSPGIEIANRVHICGVKSGRDVDKFKEAGLTPIPAQRVRPPLIKECYGHLECRVVNRIVCGDHTLFVGEVVAASVDENFLKEGKLNLSTAKPIAQKNWDYRTLSQKS